MPNAIDSTPLSASSHSPVISFRNLIAAATSNAPVTIAHAPMKKTRAIAVTPGQKNVSTPAAMPTMP